DSWPKLDCRSDRLIGGWGMRKFLFAAACAFALSASAFAADRPMPYKAVAPAPVFSWTGFYVGAHIGYGWSETSWCRVGGGVNGCAERTPGENFAAVDPHGILGGVQAGYNVQAGQVLFRLDGGLPGGGLKEGARFPAFHTPSHPHTP